MPIKTIHVAHSPDSDDAFMFYALAEGKIDTGGPPLRARAAGHRVAQPARAARRARGDRRLDSRVRVSLRPLRAAAARLVDGRPLRPAARRAHADDARATCAASASPFRDRSPPPISRSGSTSRTSSAVMTPFDQIEDAVVNGEVDAGLLIHEGQLTFGDRGCTSSQDMGEWWFEETGLPLPLGGNVVRKDLGRGSHSHESRAICAPASRMGSSTGGRRSTTRCSTRAGSIAARPTRSSACT